MNNERLIVDVLKSRLSGLVGIYLFGSRLQTQELHYDSDWDIAILTYWPLLEQSEIWPVLTCFNGDWNWKEI